MAPAYDDRDPDRRTSVIRWPLGAARRPRARRPGRSTSSGPGLGDLITCGSRAIRGRPRASRSGAPRTTPPEKDPPNRSRRATPKSRPRLEDCGVLGTARGSPRWCGTRRGDPRPSLVRVPVAVVRVEPTGSRRRPSCARSPTAPSAGPRCGSPRPGPPTRDDPSPGRFQPCPMLTSRRRFSSAGSPSCMRRGMYHRNIRPRRVR
jgi:hypothetical protein